MAIQRRNLGEDVNNFDEMSLPNLARDVEEGTAPNATPTRATPGSLKLDLIHPKNQCTRITYELRNTTSAYQKALRFESLSSLEEDLDRILKIGEEGATTH